MRGLFLAFEGGEGGGKSTQARLLADRIRASGHDAVVTREPGGTPLGGQIRSMLLSVDSTDLDPRAEALLYAADRAHHVGTVVLPALERGAVVITDRYIDSSLAYQGGARGHGREKILDLSLWAARDLVPDLTFVLDLDPAEGLVRAGREQALDRFELEAESFHQEVRRTFLALAAESPHRYVVIDARQPIVAVHEQVVAATERLLVL